LPPLVLLVAILIAPAHAAEPSLAVRDAWVRATPGAAAAYLTLENRSGRSDRLVSVGSPVARRVELHESRVENGIMRMRRIEGIAVPAGGSVRLEPGGLHVMLMGLHEPLAEGQGVPLTLSFESGATLAVDAEVRAR
jgi:copper(I)-binding protein